MEIAEIIESIKERWKKSGNDHLILEFENAPDGTATGTEGLVPIGAFLLNLKSCNLKAFIEIKDLVEAFILYAAEHRVTFR